MKKVLFASVLLLGILMFNSCTDQTDLTEEQYFEFESTEKGNSTNTEGSSGEGQVDNDED